MRRSEAHNANSGMQMINDRISILVRSVLWFLPFPILGLVAMMIFLGDHIKAVVLGALLIPILVLLIIYKRVGIRWIVISFSVLIDATVTWSCIAGNGIHDLGITAFPFVILFSSVILRKRDLLLVAAFTGACLSFIVLGEFFDLFHPLVPHTGRAADGIILTLVMLGGSAIVSGIRLQMIQALNDTKNSISDQKKNQKEIAKNIDHQNELLRQLHHRIKNHLSMISSLIDISETENLVDSDNMKFQLLAVARLHDQLYQSNEFYHVKTENYFASAIVNFMNYHGMSELQTQITIDNFEMKVNDAIHIGTFLHEIISLIPEKDVKTIDISLNRTSTRVQVPSEIKLSSQTTSRLLYMAGGIGGQFSENTEKGTTTLNLDYQLSK